MASQLASPRNRRSSHIRCEAIQDHNLGTPHLDGIGLARRRPGGDPDTDKEGAPMADRSFHRNDWPTLGVEVELQLVDAESMALRSAIADVLAHLPGDLHASAKTEWVQSCVEITSDACRSVAEVGEDLSRKIRAVERAADRCGTRLLWAASHPFSHWRDQDITPDERYAGLVETHQIAVVRHVVFGLHVHVGVDSGDKAVVIGDRLQRHLPLLLALSVNSPYWCGRPTGLHSRRTQVLEGSPFGGPPPRMRSWGDYLATLDRLFTAGFIHSVKDLWWDLRPNPVYGTVECHGCRPRSGCGATTSGRWLVLFGGSLRLGCPHDDRQAHDELGPLAQPLAAGLDPAAVHLDQSLHQGQADAQPALRPLQRVVHLREHLEDAGQLVGGDADAGVLHRRPPRRSPSARRSARCDRPARCTWRRCSGGWRTPGPAGSGRRPR